MKKKSKILLCLSILVFICFVVSFISFLFNVNSFSNKVAFFSTFICLILIILCFIYVLKEEKKELEDKEIGEYKMIVCDRDYALDLRYMMDETPVSNSSMEAELLAKYEKIAIEYERDHSSYIIYYKNDPIMLVELDRNFKEKTIDFNIIYSKAEDSNAILDIIAKEEDMKIQNVK